MYEVFIAQYRLSFITKPELLVIESPFELVENLNFDTIEYLEGNQEHSQQLVNISDNPQAKFMAFCKRFQIIGAAGGFIKSGSGKYLFIYRKGWWDLPKGKIDHKETPIAAALRESWEETRISNLKPIAPMPPTYHMYAIMGVPVLKQTSWYFMNVNGEPAGSPQTLEGITEIRWVVPDALQQTLAASYPAIQKLVQNWI